MCRCVGAPGSRSPLRFILPRHHRSRKRSFPSRIYQLLRLHLEVMGNKEELDRVVSPSGFQCSGGEERRSWFGLRLIAAFVYSGEKRSPKSCLIPV